MSIDARDVGPRVEVSVAVGGTAHRHHRFLSALEQVFAVRFVEDGAAPSAGATVTFQCRGRYLHLVDGRRRDRPASVSFSSSDQLAHSLRGAVLLEGQDVEISEDLRTGSPQVLAGTESGPVWVRRGNEEWAALTLPAPSGDAHLREHLRDGRFLALLPLVHWLREVAPSEWSPPPLRATFLFDDPNLHWPTYGFIRYPDLARHAGEHRYTATMATIPRDLWFADQRAVRLFRDSQSRLSLTLHGNDHLRRELERDLAPEDRRALLAQALRRAAAFEARRGVHVARVMIPPHGSTSREMTLDMPRIGIEAMADSRPYPWLTQLPSSNPLAGWRFVDIVDGGLPVIPRYHFSRSPDDLPLRALLGQPLILYGHHEDVAGGLEMLTERADQVNALGDVKWCSLGEIARSNFETKLEGTRLHVRLSGSVVDLEVPDGVDQLVVSGASLGEVAAIEAIDDQGSSCVPTVDNSAELLASGRRVQLRTIRADAIEVGSMPAPRPRVWPALRRSASELRDRVRPAVARVRRR